MPEAASRSFAGALDAGIAGERIVRQIEAGAFYVFTHGPDEREVTDKKAAEIDQAFKTFEATILAKE